MTNPTARDQNTLLRLTATALLLVLLAACGHGPALDTWFVDSLVKVFPEDAAGTHRLAEATFDAARNSHLSIQLALRSDEGAVGDLYVDALPLTGPGMPIESVSVRWVHDVVVTSNTPKTPPEELVHKAPALFPDAVYTEFPITVEKGTTKSVWLTVSVPGNQTPGEYKGQLRLRQGREQITLIPYTVKIYAAKVPSPVGLKITNYLNLGDSHLQQFFGCSRGSESWWRLIGSIARFMAGYYQTSIPATPGQLVKTSVVNGAIRYDFGDFDRFVETFQAAGVPGPIEGGNLLWRQRRRDAPEMVSAWVIENGRAVERKLPFTDARARHFLNTFLPALQKHLKQHGWDKNYLQGILDEPEPWRQKVFVEAARLVRRHMPGVRTIEPVGAKQDLAFMEKTVDIWVPQLGTFDDKLAEFTRHVQNGGDVWFYTCLAPKGRYPNRFIDYSLVKVRILHWINFKYDFRGFLHWGGNFWGPEPLKDTQPVINNGRTYLPPGDAYITYPNRARRSLYSSIRLEQMREGIEDFGLLSELNRRDKKAAKALAGEMVTTFTDYVRDAKRFREIHRRLLEKLSSD